MKYFYIIAMDGQIFEVSFTTEKFNLTIDAWSNGSLLLLKELGGGITGSSISKVLNEENYNSYTYSVKPKLFIKDGIWYDGAERKFVRREKWKQDEIDSRVKIEEDPGPLSLEEKQRVDKIREEITEKLKGFKVK